MAVSKSNSEKAPAAAPAVEGFVPDADRVAMVSRDANGDPAQSANFVVMVDDDADAEEKAAAHNEAGAAQGAKHVDAKDA